MAPFEPPPNVGECDSCGNTARLYPSDTPHGEGSFCAECTGFDPQDYEDEEEEAGFDCGRCGGSGGHPDTGCPGCGGSGIDRRAMREAQAEARADDF